MAHQSRKCVVKCKSVLAKYYTYYKDVSSLNADFVSVPIRSLGEGVLIRIRECKEEECPLILSKGRI